MQKTGVLRGVRFCRFSIKQERIERRNQNFLLFFCEMYLIYNMPLAPNRIIMYNVYIIDGKMSRLSILTLGYPVLPPERRYCPF